jgi:hypothetical protein
MPALPRDPIPRICASSSRTTNIPPLRNTQALPISNRMEFETTTLTPFEFSCYSDGILRLSTTLLGYLSLVFTWQPGHFTYLESMAVSVRICVFVRPEGEYLHLLVLSTLPHLTLTNLL